MRPRQEHEIRILIKRLNLLIKDLDRIYEDVQNELDFVVTRLSKIIEEDVNSKEYLT
jgi:hypothetical protein